MEDAEDGTNRDNRDNHIDRSTFYARRSLRNVIVRDLGQL